MYVKGIDFTFVSMIFMELFEDRSVE